jgi:cysteinyl-tRNA synthetase
MALKVYNTLTRRKEEFVPLHTNRVNMFVCGPTVYDYSHLGHARTYIVFDVIARYLRYKGYSVFYLQNITDIDDKIITRAAELGISPQTLAEDFLKKYYEDMDALGIDQVSLYAKATEHVAEVVSQAKVLVDKIIAYEVEGDVYFNISLFDDFGKLSGQKRSKLKAGARVEIDRKKLNPDDFVIWKKEKEGEPSWDSCWGKGRPGWHIEDTAITTTYFGNQYDIHGGAVDLIFPHHEAEIAIAESATGVKPFVKYWLHTGFLQVNGEKMSKSLGNFITIRELLKKYDPEVIRFFLINTHYRSPIDFTDGYLEEARSGLGRIRNTILRIREQLQYIEDVRKGPEESLSAGEQYIIALADITKQKFLDAMDDDFNTRVAIAALFDYTRAVNEFMSKHGTARNSVLNKLLDTYMELGGILGLFQDIKYRVGDFSQARATELINKLVTWLVELRDIARAKKDWITADKMRERFGQLGIILEDTKRGTKWSIKRPES